MSELSSSRDRPKIVFAAPADPGVTDALRGRAEVVECGPLAGSALAEAARAGDVLVTRASQRITSEILAACGGRLRAIVQASAGIDNIDGEAAARAGIEVVAIDPGNATAVAELALLSLLVLVRRIRRHWSFATWIAWSDRERLDDGELRGLRLGVVGFGRTGSRVARRALAFEMRVLAVDPYIDPAVIRDAGVEGVPTLAQLLPQCDVLSLHCPLTPETSGMIGESALSQLPRGAFFLNLARGGLVDEAALRHALDDGRIGGAALDVWQTEPPGTGSLAEHPLVLATPHLAGHTRAAHAARAENLIHGLHALLDRWGVARASG